jgi:hypothetical protein
MREAGDGTNDAGPTRNLRATGASWSGTVTLKQVHQKTGTGEACVVVAAITVPAVTRRPLLSSDTASPADDISLAPLGFIPMACDRVLPHDAGQRGG